MLFFPIFMKALILAAGLGTRLRPLTEHIPKAMVTIANKPMIDYSLKTCQEASIKEIAINLHYFPEIIKNFVQSHVTPPTKITFSYEKDLLENAGALIKLKDFFINDKTFVVIASDNLTDIDLQKMIAFHKEKKALVTIATTKADDVTKYGIISTDENDQITNFQEKPTLQEAQGDQIATCVYVFDQKIFDLLPSKPQKIHFGKEIFPQLLAAKLPLYAYQHPDYWNDVGNPNNYLQANFDFFTSKLAQHQPDLISPKATIHQQAEIVSPVVIGPNVFIDRGTKIGPFACINSHSTIYHDTIIEKSVIGKNCTIEDNSQITKSILSNNCYINKDVTADKIVLGQESYLGQIK